MKTNTFKPSDYNSVLDFCNDLYGHLNFNADFIEKTKLVKDGLIDIFKGFEEFREVTEYTYNQAISIKQKCICPITKFVYDFSNIGYSKKEILDYLDAAFNTLGFPLLAFKQEKIPFHSEIVSPFYSLFLLHDILEVINGRKNAGKIYENDTNNKKALCECSLLPLCKHIGEYEVDETCEEVPWLRLQYHTIDCPFTMMWKIFKLQEYFSYNEDMGIFVRNNKDIE